MSDSNVWVNLKQKQLSVYIEIRFMFVSNQVRSLNHATLAFKLNGIIKKNPEKKIIISSYKWEKKLVTTKYIVNQITC